MRRRRLRQRRPAGSVRAARRRQPAAASATDGALRGCSRQPRARLAPVRRARRRVRRRRSRRRSRLCSSARRAAAAPQHQLLRNNGDGTFTDITADGEVGGAGGAGLAIVPTDFDNRRDIDLLVVAVGRARRCSSRTCATARSATSASEVGPAAAPARIRRVAAGDVNKDGYHRFLLRPAGCAGRVRAERRPRAASRCRTAPDEPRRDVGRAVRRLRQRRPARSVTSVGSTARESSGTSATAGPT